MCFPFVFSPEKSIIKPLQIRLDERPEGSVRPRDTLWGDTSVIDGDRLSCRSNVNVQNVEGVNAFNERSERA